MRGRFGRSGRVVGLMFCLALLAAVGGNSAGPGFPAADTHGTKAFWNKLDQKPAKTKNGHKADVKADRFLPLSLDRAALGTVLGEAPLEHTSAARQAPLVLSLPAPSGEFQRFALSRSEIMAPGLAAQHPEITTYAGRGIDDPAATIHADLSPLGFHASVRSPQGAWYIDPYHHLDQSVYAAYYGRDTAKDDLPGAFVERDAEAGEISVDKGYYHAADTVTLSGTEFAENATVEDHDLRPRGAVRDARAQRPDRRPGGVRDAVRRRSGRQSRHAHRGGDRRRRPGHDELSGRPRRRPDLRPAHRRRAAHVPARPDHRSRLCRLPRRLGERDRGEGHADEPRLAGLRGRSLDPAAVDREQRPAQLRHVGRRQSARTGRAASPPASRRRR